MRKSKQSAVLRQINERTTCTCGREMMRCARCGRWRDLHSLIIDERRPLFVCLPVCGAAEPLDPAGYVAKVASEHSTL
jgi:hypothetical protein